MLWDENNFQLVVQNEFSNFMSRILKSLYHFISNSFSKKHLHFIRSLQFMNRKRNIEMERMDYIRISSLELIADEIYRKGVTGSVAELGVYKGDFAKDINKLFSDRKFYLFDTFSGFDSRDVATELNKNYSEGTQDFSNTSVEFVLAKMIAPQNCIVRKGYFPETANGLEDTFCFVSIDADLYEPILFGLNYFYPRLAKGGYIFVHDFNNDLYKGSREAVYDFCKKNSIPFFPLSDIGGTAIISK